MIFIMFFKIMFILNIFYCRNFVIETIKIAYKSHDKDQ
jgi:hypothetical protein